MNAGVWQLYNETKSHSSKYWILVYIMLKKIIITSPKRMENGFPFDGDANSSS